MTIDMNIHMMLTLARVKFDEYGYIRKEYGDDHYTFSGYGYDKFIATYCKPLEDRRHIYQVDLDRVQQDYDSLGNDRIWTIPKASRITTDNVSDSDSVMPSPITTDNLTYIADIRNSYLLDLLRNWRKDMCYGERYWYEEEYWIYEAKGMNKDKLIKFAKLTIAYDDGIVSLTLGHKDNVKREDAYALHPNGLETFAINIAIDTLDSVLKTYSKSDTITLYIDRANGMLVLKHKQLGHTSTHRFIHVPYSEWELNNA